MKRRKVLIAVFAVIGIVVGLEIWKLQRFLKQGPSFQEAYAAWDTGALLIAYMKTHDEKWPENWGELLSTLETERGLGSGLTLRGGSPHDTNYHRYLRETITIDWTFDPAVSDGETRIASRPDGSEFPITWENAHPNQMVQRYLETMTTNNQSNEKAAR